MMWPTVVVGGFQPNEGIRNVVRRSGDTPHSSDCRGTSSSTYFRPNKAGESAGLQHAECNSEWPVIRNRNMSPDLISAS